MNHTVRIVFLLTILLSQVDLAVGCINMPDNDIKVGQPIYTENLAPKEYIEKLLRGHSSSEEWKVALAEANTAKARNFGEFDNAIAVALLHLGKTEPAVKILEKLERTKPGSYYVAANLGTAYELIGDNEKAFEWIAKSMKRNPESHFGTEWLHLKILKAKQAIKKDPKWIETNSVLGIDWVSIGNDLSRVQVKHENTAYNADAIRKALEYQLHERTEFVKPTDPTVANLLFDLSHLVRHSRSPEHGELVLAAAYTYGYPQTSMPVPAVPAPATEVPPAVVQPPYWIPAGLAVGILTILGLATLWLLRRRASQTQ